MVLKTSFSIDYYDFIIWNWFYLLLFELFYSDGKESACNARDVRDVGLIPGSGRSPGGGHGNPLQYSCVENSMDRRAWRATVHRVAKSRTWLKQLSSHTHMHWQLLFGCSVVSDSCDPIDCSMPSFPVLHCLPEFAQTHAHWVDNTTQQSHPLSSPSPALNFPQD